jgi:beta-glucosidase
VRKAPRPTFRWGTATSAYQIEGARHVDGKGPSIWDRFADQGRMPVSGEVACDHYHRYQEDLDLLARLGVNTYRFSIAWTRVIPDGRGPVNDRGLDFYDRLVDGLLEREVEPWVTLYHWDLPQAIQEEGGWASRATIGRFAEYAHAVVERLGDRVTNWITHNEPWVAAFLGHLYGVFAPGIRDWGVALTAGHNIMVSHGRATEAIRGASSAARVGIAVDCRPALPATPADAEAARHFDGFRNRWFFDPLFGHGYPADILDAYRAGGRVVGEVPSFVAEGDMEAIAAPIEFLGLNYYTTLPVSRGSEELDDPERPPGPEPQDGYTEMGWRIDPDGLRQYLIHLHQTYSPPSIVITENGASFSTGPDSGGRIRDERRIAYLDGHISAVVEAADSGVPVDGYFAWSLLDNLEWTQGFSQRFGLVWVDHDTQQRIPKDSFDWYGKVVAPTSPQSRALAVRSS